MAALARLALLKSQSQAVRPRLFSEQCKKLNIPYFQFLLIYFNTIFTLLLLHHSLQWPWLFATSHLQHNLKHQVDQRLYTSTNACHHLPPSQCVLNHQMTTTVHQDTNGKRGKMQRKRMTSRDESDDDRGLETRLELGTFIIIILFHSTDYYLLFTDYIRHADWEWEPRDWERLHYPPIWTLQLCGGMPQPLRISCGMWLHSPHHLLSNLLLMTICIARCFEQRRQGQLFV